MPNIGKQVGRRRGRKVTPEIERRALEMAAKGSTTRAIAEHIRSAPPVGFGVDISHTAVANLLAHTRQTRADVAKEVVRGALREGLLSDLEVLQIERDRLRRLSRKAFRVAIGTVEDYAMVDAKVVEACTDAYLQTVDRINKIVHTRLHFAGADTPDVKKSEEQTRSPIIVIPPEDED